MLQKPDLPLPPPLRGADRGSFAEDTVKRRLPDIARRVLAENEDLTPAARAALETLIVEIPYSLIRPLPETQAPDLAVWQPAINQHRNLNWLESAWFFAETYFFRRIIAAVAYFETGFDPFLSQKRQGLAARQAQIQAWITQIEPEAEETWEQLLTAALWGNQDDLSLWAADDPHKPSHTDDEARQAHILVDDRPALAAYLNRRPPRRIDFIMDNAGFELVTDLMLVDCLLRQRPGLEIVLHVKLHPTFVSDAVAADIDETIQALMEMVNEGDAGPGQRLAAARENGRLRLQTDPFWTSPHPLWQMPEALRQELAAAQLIISKGDANYRRALGDAHWPYTTPLAGIVSYMPAPVLFLRTCKSNVLAGLPPDTLAVMDEQETDWATNGRWGVIQWVA